MENINLRERVPQDIGALSLPEQKRHWERELEGYKELLEKCETEVAADIVRKLIEGVVLNLELIDNKQA